VGLDYREHVVVDSKYLRPTEVDLLIGDPSKAHKRFGWKATTKFPDLVKLMVDADLAHLEETKKP
jgi:GDPmannose 4,6-dehydratase